MINNKKGQAMFVAILIMVVAMIMFIIMTPLLFQFIAGGASQTGSATGFFMRFIPWIALIFIVIVFVRITTSGGPL